MIFWIVTSALTVVVAASLVLVLMRTRSGGEPAAAYDLRVYRDQLKDVDRDLARGVIGESDAERVRTEVSRRILAADAQVQATEAGGDQSRGVSVGMSVVLIAVVIAGSMLTYRMLGAPGYGDLSLSHRVEMAEVARENRPSQAIAEANMPPLPSLDGLSAEYLALVERLRATVAERPEDVQGLTLLARNEAAIGNFVAARTAQGKVLQLKGDTADASDFTDYADMQILSAGGYVSPEAEAALLSALEIDPRNGTARYYWGLMLVQTGRPDVAFRVWDVLLREGPPDAPWIGPIRAQIEDLAARAGTRVSLPPIEAAPPAPAPTAPGPSAADVEAAGEMSPQDRAAMIQGMVERLADRLATEGGPPEEWARLITSLRALNDEAGAIAVYNNAREVFAEDQAAMAIIRQGARDAGLLP